MNYELYIAPEYRNWTREECLDWLRAHFTGDPTDHPVIMAQQQKLTVDELRVFVSKKQAQIAEDKATERRIDEQAAHGADAAIYQVKQKAAYEEKQAAEAKATEPQDRRVFAAAARRYFWAEHEANFEMTRRACGHGFSEYDLVTAVNEGRLSLQAALPAAIAQYRQEAAEQRQSWLINQATPQQLRAEATCESLETRRSAAQQHIEYELVHSYERDLRLNPALPSVPPEITPQAIREASAEQLRKWYRRWGNAQLSARLHGFSTITATVDRGDGHGPRIVSYTLNQGEQ